MLSVYASSNSKASENHIIFTHSTNCSRVISLDVNFVIALIMSFVDTTIGESKNRYLISSFAIWEYCREFILKFRSVRHICCE